MGAYEREDGAGSAWWVLLLIVPVLAVLLGGLFIYQRTVREEALAHEQARMRAEVRTEAELRAALVTRPATVATEEFVIESSEPRGERQGLAPERPAVAPEPPPAVPLHGRVLDEFGVALPGVSVLWHRKGERLPPGRRGPGGFDFRLRSSGLPPGGSYQRQGLATTDAQGRFAFEFPGGEGDVLAFAGSLYAGGEPRQEVLPDGLEQVLRLPPFPATTLLVDLIDEDGESVDPEFVRIRRAAGGKGLVRIAPHPRNVLLESGRVVVLGLGQGEWEVTLRGARSTRGRVRAVVTVDTDELRLEVRVRQLGGSSAWLTQSLGDVQDARPVPDEQNGFASYEVQGQGLRGFRDRKGNANFRHTITGFGTGPLRAAQIDLHLQAHPGNSPNDTIHFEYRGAGASPRFEWGRSIASLPGVGDWNTGESAWLTLDLARLPTDNGPLNLLPFLEDGRLDILVTDDTSVEHLELSVLP